MSDFISSLKDIPIPERRMPKLNASDQVKLAKAAKEFEGVFMDIVLKQMRSSALTEVGFMGDSPQTKMFQSMLDTEYANLSSQKGKFGIAEALMKQFGVDPKDVQGGAK